MKFRVTVEVDGRGLLFQCVCLLGDLPKVAELAADVLRRSLVNERPEYALHSALRIERA